MRARPQKRVRPRPDGVSGSTIPAGLSLTVEGGASKNAHATLYRSTLLYGTQRGPLRDPPGDMGVGE